MNLATLAKTRTAELWRNIPPTNLELIRKRILIKHRSLKNARINLKLNAASTLGDVLHNRANHPRYIKAIQKDQQLTDAQVLELWPLLGEWPKKKRGR